MIRHVAKWIGPGVLLLTIAALPARAEDQDSPDDIIEVTAALQRGSVPTAIPPEVRIERIAIRAMGANDLAEVIDAFSAQSSSLRGDFDPIVLLEGRRIGGRDEIDAIPPEAILRIEVFPEEIALQYGFPPDRRVMNVILRPKFHVTELRASAELPAGDARALWSAKAGYFSRSDKGRLNLDASFRRREKTEDEILEERWRQPRSDLYELTGVFERDLGGLSLTANAHLQRETENWRFGSNASGAPLARDRSETEGRIGFTVSSERKPWDWTAAAVLLLAGEKIADSSGTSVQTTHGNRREFELDAVTSGALANLPAGQLLATIGTGLTAYRHETAGTVTHRETAYISGSFDLPLLPNEGLVLFGEGRATFVNGDPLARYGGGLRASPISGLEFTASWSRERAVPEFEDLVDLQVLTPNVRLYDFTTGEPVYVEQHEGGNPALSNPLTETLSLRLQAKPWQGGPQFSLEFADLDQRDVTLEDPGPTPQVEAAFPQRFIRDATGVLTGFDALPLAVTREQRRELRWGVNHTLLFGDQAGAAPGELNGSQVQLALYHRWTFDHAAMLRDGTPWLDLLDGAAIAIDGGTSRHRLEAQLAYASRNLGIRMTGNWRSPTHVDGPGGTRLDFAHGFDLDLKLYVNTTRLTEKLGAAWLGGRLYLALDNLLGTRTVIRDANGGEIDYYQGSDEDSGRTIRLALRKLFF